jgi:hypothetical protein
MILAIARPHWQVTLLDSLQKRCNFSKQAILATQLGNVDVEWGRAEVVGVCVCVPSGSPEGQLLHAATSSVWPALGRYADVACLSITHVLSNECLL